jgi:Tol biopolymer transport system component
MTRSTHRRTVRSVLAAGAAVALAAAVPTAAQAASPGANGRIAFDYRGQILSISPTGANQQTLTAGPDDHAPRWSPNGTMIAFERAGDLWLMRANGSHQVRLTSGPGDDITPGWSPDGSKIVFVRSDDGSAAGRSLFVKPVAGGLPTRLTTADDGCAYAPTWTSDGRYVVYGDECPVPFDSPINLLRKVDTQTGAISTIVGTDGVAGPGGMWHFEGTAPDVSPDGRTAAFTASAPSGGECDIGAVDLSGNNFRSLARSGDCGVFASDDPAFSPNGKKVVWTGGNEAPSLHVNLVDNPNRSFISIFEGGNYFPFNADWQPKP